MTEKNNIDAWDDFEEQSFIEKYKFHLVAVGVALASMPLYFLTKSNPIGDVYADYIKNDYNSAVIGAEKIMRDSGVDPYDQHKALTVLYKIYSTPDTGLMDHKKASEYGAKLFKSGKNEVLARYIIIHMKESGYTISKMVPYLEYLAKKGDDTSKLKLIDHYISEGSKNLNRKAMDLLKLLPQSPEIKMKQAKLMLDRDSGEYNFRGASILIEEASRMGDPEGSAYLALQKLEESKRDQQEASELIREFVFLSKRSLEGGYDGDKAREIITIIELGRHNVPRDPNFADNLKPKEEIVGTL